LRDLLSFFFCLLSFCSEVPAAGQDIRTFVLKPAAWYFLAYVGMQLSHKEKDGVLLASWWLSWITSDEVHST
jgi:hypothetical protein